MFAGTRTVKRNIGLHNLRLKAKAYLRESRYLKLHFGKIALRRKMSLTFPSDLYIEPTNNCNLNCIMCPRKLSSRKIGYMDFELFKKIIDESVQYGKRRVITLHKDGESLLHPRLAQMIAYAKQRKAAHILRLSTNALLLNEAKCRELIRSGLDTVTVSLDGTNEATYEKIRGGDYGKVVNNIARFIKIRNELGRTRPWVTLQMIKMAGTLEQIQQFKEQWKSVVDEIAIKELLNWGGAIPAEESMLPNLDLREPCGDLWTYLTVNWDGNVSICCLDFDCQCIVGDVNSQSLKEIWGGKAISRYRLAHLDRLWQQVPLCQDCNVWQNQLPVWNRRMAKKYRLHALTTLGE